jgi:hypothetical protein
VTIPGLGNTVIVGQVPGASETGGLIPGLQSIASQLAAGITPA